MVRDSDTKQGIPVPSMDWSHIGKYLAEWLARGSRMKATVLVTRSQKGRKFEVMGAYGLSPGYLEQVDVADEAITLAAFQGRPVVVPDIANDTRLIHRELAQEEGIASMIVVPMLIDHCVVGVVHFYNSTPRRFSRRDLDALTAQAQVAALALENARLYSRSRILFEVAQTVSSTLELREVGNLIAEAAAKAMGVKGCSVRMLSSTRQLELVGAYGLSRAYLEKGPLSADVSIAEALQGRPVVIEDAPNDRRLQYPEAARAEGIASLASIPMILKGVVTGVLRIYSDATLNLGSDEIEFLMALASVGAAALENARLYDGIKRDFEILMDEIIYMRRAAKAKSSY